LELKVLEVKRESQAREEKKDTAEYEVKLDKTEQLVQQGSQHQLD
jgi:hypothetical protein